MDITWSNQLDVGSEQMNDEHKMLINYMRDLHNYNQRAFDKEKVLETFTRFLEYVELHFEDEEAHMKKMAYPRLAAHKKIHEELIASLMRQREEFLHSTAGRLPSSVFDFFNTWILTHILIADKDYGAHGQAQHAKIP